MKKYLLIGFVVLSQLAWGNKVYVVLGSDTSVWTNTSGQEVKYTYANEFDYAVFTNPTGVYAQVFEEAFRNMHTDSLGNPFRITWFMHAGGWFQYGSNATSISTLFMIKKYWQAELDRWGDALEYHFHHFKWTGSAWAMADEFADTIWDFDWTMSQMIIDESLYPVSFRSGWNYMDNLYQQYLERWIPFRMEGGSWMPDCTPYHPSYSNYRNPGTMKGWEVRHYYMKSFTSSIANQIFNFAHLGNEQVVCIWSHQNETDFIQQIANVDSALHNAATAYPDVQFLYCSGKEAMQKWLHTTDTTPPALSLSTMPQDNNIHVVINSESAIYQEQPWVAARKYSGDYVRLDTENIGGGSWKFSYSNAEIDRVVVAVCDIYGNVSLAEVRDGSRQWITQSELYQSMPQNVDVESETNKALLAKSATGSIVIDQPNYDGQTDILLRSYWIGQTLLPQSTGISKVVFGAKVNQPAQYRVELRSTLPSGFPDDNPAGLLASATATLSVSGTTTAWLNYNGLQMDGRTYALVFKIISGSAEIRLNTTSVYPDGTLIRAYGLDWITIPDFDCLFQIYDESLNLSIDQPLYNSDAYISERGYFVAQTFLANFGNIAGVELNVTEAQSGETIGVQLHKTLPDGSPDFSFDSRIYIKNNSISGPGIHYLPLDWKIPRKFLSQPLAFVFLAPQEGKNSIRLALDSGNPYSPGDLFVSDDLVSSYFMENSDLYLKVFVTSWVSSGTLTMSYDAGRAVCWSSARISADIPPGTSIRCRFRLANTPAHLSSALWSEYFATDLIHFPSTYYSRLIQAQILLESSGTSTPVLDGLELFYEPQPTEASYYWELLY